MALGGPMLFPYVYWILEDSKKRGVENLYFIARDGFVLKVIADRIIANKSINLSTYYLIGSRVSWRDPIRNNDPVKIQYAREYMLQEVDTTKPFAFVEFAGTGETQDCAVKLLQNTAQ